jgi:cellulose biosynthesis protein BcsQ
LKNSVFSRGIDTDISAMPTIKRSPTIDIKDVDDDSPMLENIATLSDEYEDQSTKVVEKVIERVVEKVVEVQVEKIVNIGGKQKSYKNGIRTIVVTGDRKTGVTRTALNMAAHFAKSNRTLYVDYDIERHGSLLYFGLENISLEEEHVQKGLAFLRNLKTLDNVTYTFPKGGFDCLISTHGTEFEDGRLKEAQRILSTQRDYKTVIIDCPLENMHYLEDIVLYSEVMICVEPDLPCVLNTILGLSKTSENDKFLSFLFNNGHYFLSKDNNVAEFQTSMSYISEIFSLDDENINWGTIPVLGSVVNFEKVLEIF